MERAIPGPENLTIVEKLVGLFHVPYEFGALLLSAMIGPPGALLVAYAQTGNVDTATSATVALFTSNVPSAQSGAATALIFLLFFYLLYAIRYMRTKILEDEENVAGMLPGGEVAYHAIFASLSRIAPPLIISAILVAAIIPPALQSSSLFFTATPGLVYFLIAVSLALFIFSTFVWVYFSGIRGLTALGGKPLKLKPYNEDSMLGVRPLGSLSLSFALVYFAGLVILAVVFIVNSAEAIPPAEGAIMGVLIFSGIVFFILPLNTIHQKMVGVKRQELTLLRNMFNKTRESSEQTTPAGPNTSLSDLKETLVQLTNVLMFDVTKGEVYSIPTWPFDTTILGRFAVILLSVTAIVMSKYIALGLGFSP